MSHDRERGDRRTARPTAPIAGQPRPFWFDLAVAGLTLASVLLVLIGIYYLFSPESSLGVIVLPLVGIALFGAGVLLVLRRDAARRSRATKKLRDTERDFFKEVERDITSRVKGRAR